EKGRQLSQEHDPGLVPPANSVLRPASAVPCPLETRSRPESLRGIPELPMIVLPVNPELALGPETAGLLMTPEEFDAIEEYDEDYRYELVNGVLVVTPVPLAEETGPNELLGYLLLGYQ